jgi:hypothetical protein
MTKVYTLLAALLTAASASAVTTASATVRTPGADRSQLLRHTAPLTRAVEYLTSNEAPELDPQGTVTHYAMAYTNEDYWGAEDYVGYKFDLCLPQDGSSTAYIRSLVPGYNRAAKGSPESWAKATISADGSTLTIPGGQIVYCNDDRSQVLYLEVMTTDDAGQIVSVLDNYVLNIAPDGTITVPSEYADVMLGVYEEDPDDPGFYCFSYDYSFEQITDYPTTALPQGATLSQWVLSYEDTARLVEAGVIDGTLYVKGLTENCPDDLLCGTISADGVASLPIGTLLTSGDLQYYRFYCAIIDGDDSDSDDSDDEEEDETITLNPVSALELTISADGSTIAQTNPSVCIAEVDYAYTEAISYFNDATLTAYAGDVAATPAAPSIIWDEDFEYFLIDIPNSDVDGNFINPSLLTYTLVIDGKDYTFNPDTYEGFEAPLTAIPYDYTDNWDLGIYGTQRLIFFYDSWTTAGVYTTYTAGGEARNSAITYVTDDSAISEVSADAPTAVTYFDLTGRQVKRPCSGNLYITNQGRKIRF